MKKALSIFLIILLLITNACALNAFDYKTELNTLCSHTQNTITNPLPGSVGGEWAVVGLSQSKTTVPSNYFDKYVSNLSSLLKEKSGKLSETKHTEYSRTIIALTAIGKNATDILGYNLITPILDYEKTVRQGINGAIWALIALNCGNYYPEEKELREKYINKILSMQSDNGGFSLSKSFQPDPDVTAMALQALSYYKSNKTVAAAISKAEEFLSKIKHFPSCESVSQAITALTALGKNSSDTEAQRLLNILYTFQCETGGYYHLLNESKENKMATEQALCALASLKKADESGKWLYSFKKTFSDTSDCLYRNEIDFLSERGIVGGRTENMFFPESEITLAELCTMAVKALKLEGNSEDFSSFKNGSWFYPYISAVNSLEIIASSDDGQIFPEKKVTYREATEFFNNCANFLQKESFAEDISGKKGYLLRAEAAKIIYELIK